MQRVCADIEGVDNALISLGGQPGHITGVVRAQAREVDTATHKEQTAIPLTDHPMHLCIGEVQQIAPALFITDFNPPACVAPVQFGYVHMRFQAARIGLRDGELDPRTQGYPGKECSRYQMVAVQFLLEGLSLQGSEQSTRGAVARVNAKHFLQLNPGIFS